MHVVTTAWHVLGSGWGGEVVFRFPLFVVAQFGTKCFVCCFTDAIGGWVKGYDVVEMVPRKAA